VVGVAHLGKATMMICAAPSPTLRELFDDMYHPRQLVGCSQKTIEQYEIAIRHWQRFAGSATINQIDSNMIAKFAAFLLNGRSAATVNKTLRHVMAPLRFAADEDLIDKPPKFRKLKEPKRSPLALTREEFLAVLSVCENLPGSVCGIPAPIWWRSLLCADWESGLRMSAMLSITTADVLLDQGGFFCQAEPQKDKEAAWFRLSPDTLNLIRSIYDPSREMLWPRDVTAETVGRRFRAILNSSGIYAPKGCGMRFHRIRKSTASYVTQAGGNATAKLGHSTATVTQRYLDPRIVRADVANDLVPAPVG